jgi:hypothetical protein
LRIIQKNCCLLAMLGSKDLSFLSWSAVVCLEWIHCC